MLDSSDHNRRSLQVLFRPLLNAIQGLVQVRKRVGHTEAQVAFSETAKPGSGQAGDAGMVEQRIGQRLRFPSRLGDVGEGVKRSLRQTARKARNAVEAGDKGV